VRGAGGLNRICESLLILPALPARLAFARAVVRSGHEFLRGWRGCFPDEDHQRESKGQPSRLREKRELQVKRVWQLHHNLKDSTCKRAYQHCNFIKPS
jgi:hypothetical protein